MKAYIAKETIAPAFPEHVEEVIEAMKAELEEAGYEVEVGEHSLAGTWRADKFEPAEEAVEKAWRNACENISEYLYNGGNL